MCQPWSLNETHLLTQVLTTAPPLGGIFIAYTFTHRGTVRATTSAGTTAEGAYSLRIMHSFWVALGTSTAEVAGSQPSDGTQPSYSVHSYTVCGDTPVTHTAAASNAAWKKGTGP